MHRLYVEACDLTLSSTQLSNRFLKESRDQPELGSLPQRRAGLNRSVLGLCKGYHVVSKERGVPIATKKMSRRMSCVRSAGYVFRKVCLVTDI